MCPTVCASCPRGGPAVAAAAPVPQVSQPVQQAQQPIYKTVVSPQAAAAHPHQQPQTRAVQQQQQQQLPVQPQPVYQNAQVAPPRPAQSGVPTVQSAPQPKPTQPLYPQQQQQQQAPQSQQALPAPTHIIPPSPIFNPQPLNLPPPPPGIPLPPYSTQQLPEQRPAAVQQAAPTPAVSAPLPPPQQQQQSFTGNYAPEQPHSTAPTQPQQVQPFFPQQQQLGQFPQQPQFNAFGQPQQPFQPFPGFQMPQPFGLPPQNPQQLQQLQQGQAQFQQPFGQNGFDLFHPPQNLPGLAPFGAPPGTPQSPAAQQSALLNPFAPFLHQSYSAGGVTPDPHHFNPFNLPQFTLQPTTTTPAPLQPLPGAPHHTFFDARQQQPPQHLQQLQQPPQHLQQLQQPQQQFNNGLQQQALPQPQFQHQQNLFAPQPNAFQVPPMFQMPGLPPMPGLPQIPQPFNAQQPNFIPPSPSAPAQLQQLPTAAVPQPVVQQGAAALPVPAAAAVPQQQALPQISTSIDAAPATFDKAASTYEKTGKIANIAPPKPASPQCPSQPGWGACISKQLANERFRNCCARLGDGCTPLCDYDATLTNMQLAVLTGRCPLAKVGDVMVCASGYEDATPCCQAYGVFEPGYEHCRPYCNPSGGIPDGGLLSEKYKCLVKLTQIQQCFFVTQRP
ncbi:hypothetical protein PFISCL1PPCAC_5591 [Pristionchus fissidentatus]|uniref:Domain of unknown function DB domain-containing protein n=1 Tax=Pristionchus fissidentatus TaxID=1538716 RepID=A0AAV5V725_9BILA|nr:hypothetical protein PFISCL1PPCAC_5591 [Pristionchus fissidentatus]